MNRDQLEVNNVNLVQSRLFIAHLIFCNIALKLNDLYHLNIITQSIKQGVPLIFD
jgi:hypothetical protein